MNDNDKEKLKNERMMPKFGYAHLQGNLQEISKQFHDVAQWVVLNLPPGPERTVVLRKLLEGKDCAVRSALKGEYDKTLCEIGERLQREREEALIEGRQYESVKALLETWTHTELLNVVPQVFQNTLKGWPRNKRGCQMAIEEALRNESFSAIKEMLPAGFLDSLRKDAADFLTCEEIKEQLNKRHWGDLHRMIPSDVIERYRRQGREQAINKLADHWKGLLDANRET